ncbi:phage protein NinX family protein [Serratia odorifera]|uniref:phage protein NinX family protein n=1 Tax=Serratia odorifera TaxID=618 RepID=UPI003D283393
MIDYSKMDDRDINTLVDAVTGNRTMGNDYCNNPADAWPIIEKNNITIIFENGTFSCALGGVKTGQCFEIEYDHISEVDNPLRAAMVVFLMMTVVD